MSWLNLLHGFTWMLTIKFKMYPLLWFSHNLSWILYFCEFHAFSLTLAKGWVGLGKYVCICCEFSHVFSFQRWAEVATPWRPFATQPRSSAEATSWELAKFFLGGGGIQICQCISFIFLYCSCECLLNSWCWVKKQKPWWVFIKCASENSSCNTLLQLHKEDDKKWEIRN